MKDPRKKRMRNHEFLHGRIQKIPSESGWDGGSCCSLVINIFHRLKTVQISLEKQLDVRDTIVSRWWSIQEFLRKPIATCDFQGRGSDPYFPLWIYPCSSYVFSRPEVHKSHILNETIQYTAHFMHSVEQIVQKLRRKYYGITMHYGKHSEMMTFLI